MHWRNANQYGGSNIMTSEQAFEEWWDANAQRILELCREGSNLERKLIVREVWEVAQKQDTLTRANMILDRVGLKIIDTRRESMPSDDGQAKAAAEGCACDNCFYGRHALADALLDAWVRIDELIENNAEALKEMEKIGWPCMLSELPALYVEITDEATALRNEVAALQGI